MKDGIKRFLSRMNRGIVLAVVLLIGMSIYFVIDARAFDRERDAIEEMIEGFIVQANRINALILDLPYEEVRDEIDAFIEEFFIEYRAGYHGRHFRTARQSAESGLQTLSQMPEDMRTDEVELSLARITSMQKQATNAVRVRFYIDAEINSEAGLIFFNGFSVTRYHFGTPGTTNVRINQETVDALLIRSGGQWRFAEVWHMGGMTTVITVG